MGHTVIESNLKNLFAIVIITMWFQIFEIERNHFDDIPLFRKAHRKQKGSLSHSSPFESIQAIQVFKFTILVLYSSLPFWFLILVCPVPFSQSLFPSFTCPFPVSAVPICSCTSWIMEREHSREYSSADTFMVWFKLRLKAFETFWSFSLKSPETFEVPLKPEKASKLLSLK